MPCFRIQKISNSQVKAFQTVVARSVSDEAIQTVAGIDDAALIPRRSGWLIRQTS